MILDLFLLAFNFARLLNDTQLAWLKTPKASLDIYENDNFVILNFQDAFIEFITSLINLRLYNDLALCQ